MSKTVTGRSVLAGLLVMGLVFVMGAADLLAQDKYPSNKIELIIPYPPGGSDALGRKIAASMAKNTGADIVVSNVPGASTQVASRKVKDSAPDGYTIYIASPPEFVAGPAFYANLPFDPMKDFTLISYHAQVPYLLLVNTQIPVKNYEELIAYIKGHKQDFRMGSYGALSQSDIIARRFRKATGLDFDIIPYSGGRPSFNALLAGEIQALFGTPMIIATTVVISFLLLGQLLFASGGSSFFTEIAMATMGGYRGGAAKIAVTASGLFGSISGSAVSNVLSTGVITIPLMRRSGYSPESAGAIEAVASTGGQLMPPLMGASAFVMAEFLEVPYSDVVIAAIVPAVLYYAALFIVADLEAARTGIARVDRSTLPAVGKVLRAGWFFPVPFGMLIWLLFGGGARPETAALYSAGVLVLCALAFGYEGKRLGLGDAWDALRDTGHSAVELILIVAAAGLVIGVLNLSGLSFGLTLTLVKFGGGNLAVLLVLAAAICIVLGMGMPTLGVYVLVAALVAPALTEVGVDRMAAHMFVLYFGMMSMITPPVAIAAFAAATLTRADPMRTGYAAVRFGWVAYIIPFLFVLSPTLILKGPPASIALAVATALVGVWLVSVAVAGYVARPLSVPMRLVFAAFGLAALVPAGGTAAGWAIDAAGVAGGLLLTLREWRAPRT